MIDKTASVMERMWAANAFCFALKEGRRIPIGVPSSLASSTSQRLRSISCGVVMDKFPGARNPRAPGWEFQHNPLKINLPAELEDTWISDGVYLSRSGVIRVGRVTRKNRVVNPGELGMVPGVERLRS
jgi:hypothetical protein